MSSRDTQQAARATTARGRRGADASADVLSQRALNRALLARQMLLERVALPAEQAIEHLVGMQAQAPNAPYVGLWTRLDGFRTDELATLVTERRAVRSPLMRATVHLVSARDCLALRPLMQPALARGFASSPFGRRLKDMDLDALVTTGRALLEERPRTRAALGPMLGKRWPGRDATSLAYAVSYLVPLVQVPPRGVWGAVGPVAWTTVEKFLGAPLDLDPSPDEMVLRYLAAFGPASVRDVQTWSGLTRLRPVVERLRPRLRVFQDEQGSELFDLPDAPRPDPQLPAPPRFLPEYDNLLLSHADRRRVMAAGRRVPLPAGNGGTSGTVLLDGFYEGTWLLLRHGQTATLRVDLFRSLSPEERAALAEEGSGLLAFAAANAISHDMLFRTPQ